MKKKKIIEKKTVGYCSYIFVYVYVYMKRILSIIAREPAKALAFYRAAWLILSRYLRETGYYL